MQSFRKDLSNRPGPTRSAALALVAAIMLAGCDVRSASIEELPPPEVDVATVAAQAVTLTETLTGRLQAPETVLLRPRVSGYIQEVAFIEGEWVEAGDLLFQIDPRPYEAAVNAARAELAQARSQLQQADSEAKRAGRLQVGQAISQEEYDQRQAAFASAQARVSQAQADLDTAELNLQYTRVTSPLSGRTGRAQVTRGNLARADETLLTAVVSVNPLHVYFEGDEALALSSLALRHDYHRGQNLEPGQGKGAYGQPTVWIGLSGEEGFPRRGELDYVDNRLNTNTGTLQFRAVLDNPDGALKPGQFARVRMPVGRLEQALLVRREAVLTDQDRRYVYVVDANDAVLRKQVTTGAEVGGLTVIEQGLEAGDRVIVNGTQQVQYSGMQVRPRQIAMRPEQARRDSALAAANPVPRLTQASQP